MTRLLNDKRGFTLIELLVAMTISLFILAAAGTVLVTVKHSGPTVDKRAAAIQRARFVVDRVTRELRQGWAVPTATASQLAILTYVNGSTCGGNPGGTAIPCLVTYSCSAGACTRTVAQPTGAAPGPAVQVVNGLSSSNVFSYQPTSVVPAYVGITLAFPGAASGSNAVTLADGAALRNPATG